MHLFWWQQLPLLILIQLFEHNSANHKLSAEALSDFKSTIGTPQHFSGRVGGNSCLRKWANANCYKLNDPGVVSLATRRGPFFLYTRFIKLSHDFIPSNSAIELKEEVYKSGNKRITAGVDGNNGVPTLTPLEAAEDKTPSKQKVAAIVGGVGAALLVILILVLVYFCLTRVKKFLRQASETASSGPSPPPEFSRGSISPYAAVQAPSDAHVLRKLSIPELEHATSNFSQSNIIGESAFGLVYKGLLLDGSIVAIKRFLHKPVVDFIQKAKHLASVHHKHLVQLIGYCEDRHQLLLVYDYIPNGNVGNNNLYDTEGLPIGKLDMRQRLSIALGAAKGLQYLHSLVPPLFHMHFRTSNVLLCDNFTAKVSDYGILKLVVEGHRAGSSSSIDYFLDPELNLSNNFSEQSDVYSFGVFLLELISGREAHGKYQSNSGQNLVQEVRQCSVVEFMDKTLEEHAVEAARKMMELALQCIDIRRKRPSMLEIVEEIEEIQVREMGYLQPHVGEEIGSVTLGSELFK